MLNIDDRTYLKEMQIVLYQQQTSPIDFFFSILNTALQYMLSYVETEAEKAN